MMMASVVRFEQREAMFRRKPLLPAVPKHETVPFTTARQIICLTGASWRLWSRVAERDGIRAVSHIWEQS